MMKKDKALVVLVVISVITIPTTLYLTGVLQTNYDKNGERPTQDIITQQENCQTGKTTCVIQFDYTVYDTGTLQNSSLSWNSMHIMNFVPINDNTAYVSNDNDEFMLIPNYHGIVYFFINGTNGFFDPIETEKQNPFIKKFSFGDPLGIGKQGWVMQVNVSRSDSNWISTEPSVSDSAVGIKTKFTIPITVVVHTNETDIKVPITTTLTEATNRAELYPNDTLVEKTNKQDCCYYKSVDRDALSNKTTEISTELHLQGEKGQLWWTDINGTHNCKVYRYQSGGDGFYSYSYNGVGCSDYQAHKFDKVQYAMDHPSNEQLTEETNVCTVGFGCPNNATSALTYGTEMQMLWGEIQDQNKKILENQNIMMCLEVVKNPDTWVQVGKYLTERGINCTGLDIK